MKSDTWLKELRKQGYRLTEARRAVVETVAQSPRALSPTDVYNLSKEHYPALGLVTVYRTLEKLEELHLVQRVHQEEGCNAYLSEAEGHQHLLICTECKKAVYFEGDDLGDFFVGERLSVYIATGTRETIIVPSDYLFIRYGLVFAMVKGEGEVVVQTGLKNIKGTEVLSGLRVGDVLALPETN